MTVHVPVWQRAAVQQDALVEAHEARHPCQLRLLAARRGVLRRRRGRQEASQQPRRLCIEHESRSVSGFRPDPPQDSLISLASQ